MSALRAITYTRVSSDDQANEGTGLETQQIEAERLAERLGAVVVARESDPGISGTLPPGPERPAIERALRLLETGQADALIAYNASRLGRKTSIALSIWERVQEAGARLFLCDIGEVTEANEIIFTLMGGYAQHEWRMIKQRMMEGRRRWAERGRMPSRALPPYGYRIVKKGEVGPEGEEPGQYYIFEDEARVARLIFEWYAGGDSLYQVCRKLQNAGIPCSLENKGQAKVEHPMWCRSTIKRILNNTAYKGYAVWGKTEIHKRNGREVALPTPEERRVSIPTPALVSPQLWQECQDRLQSNRQARSTRTNRRYLFSSLTRCHKCGKSMSILYRPTEPFYTCRYHSKASNAAGIVCNKRFYGEGRIRDAVRTSLTRMKDDPEFTAFAMELYHEEGQERIIGEDLPAVQKALKELAARETATARAQVEALAKGRGTQVYEQLLDEIHAERTRLEARQREMEAQQARRQEDDPKEAAELAARYAGVLLEVLDNEKLYAWEKNDVFVRLIDAILPGDEEVKIFFHPFRTGSKVVPVACVF
ncbi:MAG TPA: recombinase family protein [Chthonomonadaceae bacterium]|nr:recombinase family protein [Chthonomonadaceae bacterium]